MHWTVTNGLFGIPLDCLHREHWAWTDPATIASSLYPRKHMPRFWTKWLDDIKDAQLEDGSVPDICPNYVRRDDPDPAWGGNYPILVWYLYQYFDDSRFLHEHYEPVRLWVDYLTSAAENNIVNEGHYGDHMLPGAAPGEEEFVSSETPPAPSSGPATTIWAPPSSPRSRATWARKRRAAHYRRLAEAIKEALNREWLDPARAPLRHRLTDRQPLPARPRHRAVRQRSRRRPGHRPQHRRHVGRPSPHRQHRRHVPDRHA